MLGIKRLKCNGGIRRGVLLKRRNMATPATKGEMMVEIVI